MQLYFAICSHTYYQKTEAKIQLQKPKNYVIQKPNTPQ